MLLVRKSYILILITLVFNFSKAQEYSFIPYSVEDGLSQTQVQSICPDDIGHLWIATVGGVSRFDGENFKTYSKENGLSDNSSVEIINKNGFIWIATKQGITRVKEKQIATVDLSNLTNGNHITAISFGKNDNLWIGIENIGLIEMEIPSNDAFHLKEVKKHNPHKGLFIRTIKCDNKGRVWLGGKGYLGYYENLKWTEIKLPSNTSNISDIDQDQDGNYWISTYDKGVFKLNLITNDYKNFNQKSGLISSTIRSIFIDSKDRIWLSSKNGVSCIENKVIKNFNRNNGLLQNNINTIGEDLEQNIWFGTDGSGIYRFTGEEFVNYTTSSKLPSNYVMSICEDSENNIWLSTYDQGVCCLKGDKITHYNIKNSALINNTIWTSICRKDGTLLFGSSGGLVELKNGKIRNYANLDWLPSNRITSLFEDSKNRIWIGCSKGLAIIDKELKYTFNETSEFRGRKIRAISPFKNQMYVGSSSGIFTFDSELNSKKFSLKEKLSKNIYCLKNWEDSLLFIGSGNGLFFYDNSSIYQINLHPSFSANYINFLELENENVLWIGTNFGIFELQINTLNSNNPEIRHHTVANGLKSVETNLNSSFIDSKGNLWMGTGKGLTKYNSINRTNNLLSQTPIPKIKEVQLFLKETNWENYNSTINPYNLLPKNLTLTSNNNYLTFYFSAANLSRNSDLQYQFILENFDLNWSPNYKQNSFTYANLPPGEYEFKIKASVDNIVWSKPASFKFKIDYPYYQKSWFILLETLLLFSIIFLVWKWRSNVVKRNIKTQNLIYKSNLLSLEQQSLNASMNRHFIFNALNSIQYFINTQDKLSANKYLSSFAKLIRKNLDSSMAKNNLVPLSDEIERLELYLSLEHMRFKTKFEYSIEIDPSLKTEFVEVPAMFMQPFVENSIWHGILPKNDTGKIEILIGYKENNDLFFLIKDNGIGVENSLKAKGIHQHQSKGINITSNRIDVLKRLTKKEFIIIGPLQINDINNEAKGTKVEIIMKRNSREKL
ncbi:MAG: two-component regulator propeller domain-containing protein [Flavobacteriales bacterium]|nr:two-component regulator propeller domain-containing protein [Flavobacteriales bacterium]